MENLKGVSSRRICVTGANGFVGQRLVLELIRKDCHVTGIGKRSRSVCPEEPSKQFEYHSADLVSADPHTLATCISGSEFVFHLAALTRHHKPERLVDINLAMTQNVLEACSLVRDAPVLIYVSSISACGAGQGEYFVESGALKPNSYYGKSKKACEELTAEYSRNLAISVVRPPIVLGQGDHNGLQLFKSIDRWHRHFIPGERDEKFSVIHVDDLIAAMIAVAEKGERLSYAREGQSHSKGIYFAAADEVPTYGCLGEMIGFALGIPKTKVKHTPGWLMNSIGWFNEMVGRAIGSVSFLNRDKMRDALSGSWACSNAKIKRETGFAPGKSFQERLDETVEWYRANGWLPRERGEKSERKFANQ